MVVPQHVLIHVEPLAISCLPTTKCTQPSEFDNVQNCYDFPFLIVVQTDVFNSNLLMLIFLFSICEFDVNGVVDSPRE